MAQARKSKPKPITFILTAKQRKDLGKRGLLKNKSAEVKVRYVSGKLHLTRHKKHGRYVASNAAFA